MSEQKTAWTRPLLPPKRKHSLGSRQLKRTAEVGAEPAAAKEETPPAAQPVAAPKKRRGRPPGSKNKPKAPPTVDVAAERAAPVPAPVAAAEEPEPLPTPATMRAMRQLSRADRFEELLTRNTMEF